MKQLVLAVGLAFAATAGQAGVGPLFLPDLTFPTPAPAPTVSTQACAPSDVCAS